MSQAIHIRNLIYRWHLPIIATAIFTFSIHGSVNPVSASSQIAEDWTKLEDRGTTALDAGDYWIAEPALKQAMELAQRCNPKDIRLAKSLGELGRLYTVRGRFDEAEAYLEEELSIRELVQGNDKFKCIPTMGSLIKFYLTYGTKDKAAPLTEEMLSLVEGKLSEARSGSYKIRLQKGQPLQGWLGVAAPVMKDPIIEWAITCDSVGNCYRTAGNFDLADRLFKVALDIKTTVLGNNHLSLANSYDSLGGLYLEKNDLHEAEAYFADALEITEKILPAGSPEIYARLDKLAKCFIKEGKFPQAEALYLRARHFWDDEPSNSGNEARVLYALGSLYAQEHKYEEALPYLRDALQLSEQFNGPDSITVVPYLKKYAYTLYYLGQKTEMGQLNMRASSITGTTP